MTNAESDSIGEATKKGIFLNKKEVNYMTTNTTNDAKTIKDILENVLIVYEIPEVCLENVMVFIEGVKVGAKNQTRANLRGELKNEQLNQN